MWNSLSLLQLRSSRFTAVSRQTGEHEEFSIEEGPSSSNNYSRDKKVNVFSQLKTEKLVTMCSPGSKHLMRLMFTRWGSSSLFIPVYWGTSNATGQTFSKHLCLCYKWKTSLQRQESHAGTWNVELPSCTHIQHCTLGWAIIVCTRTVW